MSARGRIRRGELMQPPRQENRESNLIKLQSRPIGGPVDPAVLRKTAVRPLDGGQPNQRAQRRARLTGGEERCCAVDKVARPNEVIAAQILITLRFAPRNAQRGDRCALKNFVFMRQQHASAQSIHSAAIGRIAAKIEFGIHDGALPLTNIPLAI